MSDQTRCAHCGQIIRPPGYNGYLSPHLAEILAASDAGKTVKQIAEMLSDRVIPPYHGASDPNKLKNIIAMLRTVLQKNGRPTAHKIDVDGRNKTIIEMRQKGASFAEIGRALNLSRDRARSIYQCEKLRMNNRDVVVTLDTNIDQISDMPIRLRNCLKNSGIETLRAAMMISDSDLLSTPNFGRTSFYALKALIAGADMNKVKQS